MFNVHSPEGSIRHCEVASIIITNMELDLHTKHAQNRFRPVHVVDAVDRGPALIGFEARPGVAACPQL